MAYKIATEQYAYNIGVGKGSPTSNLMVTYSRAIALGCQIRNNSYSNTQLVRQEDLWSCSCQGATGSYNDCGSNCTCNTCNSNNSYSLNCSCNNCNNDTTYYLNCSCNSCNNDKTYSKNCSCNKNVTPTTKGCSCVSGIGKTCPGNLATMYCGSQYDLAIGTCTGSKTHYRDTPGSYYCRTYQYSIGYCAHNNYCSNTDYYTCLSNSASCGSNTCSSNGACSSVACSCNSCNSDTSCSTNGTCSCYSNTTSCNTNGSCSCHSNSVTCGSNGSCSCYSNVKCSCNGNWVTCSSKNYKAGTNS